MTHPKIHTETFLGVADTPYEVEISAQYRANVITITPVSNTGTITIRAKAKYNNQFEYVDGGYLSLSTNRLTLRITGYPLQALELTTSDTVTFTVDVEQYIEI